MASDPITPVADTPERRAFYDRISGQNLTPLWLSLASLVTPEPASACRPASWAFADIRAAMLEAGGLITATAPPFGSLPPRSRLRPAPLAALQSFVAQMLPRSVGD